MPTLENLLLDLTFRLSNLSWLDWLDLALVALVFYLLINLVQRSRIAFLLRGVLLLIVPLLVTSFLLPLRTFGWLVRVTLLAFLISLPVIFHNELRRLLENVGRSIGLTGVVRQATTETVLPSLVRAVERMSETRTGALIVLEGDTALPEIIETGVPVEGRVSSELLQSIFHHGSPLHDGAVVIRGGRVVAASCVLPVSRRSLPGARRLGTRHRAAVGLSERSDALMVVVSEETGAISVAYEGQLHQRLELVKLRERIVQFGRQPAHPPASTFSLPSLLESLQGNLASLPQRPPSRGALGTAALAALLALLVWWIVLGLTSPLPVRRVENIPLEVTDIPEGMALTDSPPSTVSALIQTTQETLATLSSTRFRATLSLEDLPPGEHEVSPEVEVRG
ncbi:MAG: diadenylate cyclase CdaA, partial [Chloroflexota bacterium]|nr:diadenylate cyclase CdaA [Chloroflexota bacterium]